MAGPVPIPDASVSGQSGESSDGVCVSMDLPQVEFSLDPVVLGVKMMLEVRGIPWFLPLCLNIIPVPAYSVMPSMPLGLT